MTEQINLNITDIADAVKIIDYAAEQGAFKGWGNIRQILIVRDRLDMFIAAANAANAASTPAEQPAEEASAVNSAASELDEAEAPRRPRKRR
jgi:hypothetical protein